MTDNKKRKFDWSRLLGFAQAPDNAADTRIGAKVGDKGGPPAPPIRPA